VAVYPQAVARADWDFHESFLARIPKCCKSRSNFKRDSLIPIALFWRSIASPYSRSAGSPAPPLRDRRESLSRRASEAVRLLDDPRLDAVHEGREATGRGRESAARFVAACLDEDVADLVLHNVGRYADWIERG